MARTKAPWHRGSHQVRARRVTQAAYANPDTRCWRCGRTLAEHEPHKTGKPARWTAGHLVDSQIDGHLAPEASTCNYTAGTTLRNQKAQRTTPNTSRPWLTR